MKGKVKLIAENRKKYVPFTKHIKGSKKHFHFIDEYSLLHSPLDKLASYLTDYPITKLEFIKDGYSTQQTHLWLKKGTFPYDYIKNVESWKDCQKKKTFTANSTIHP